MTVVATAKPKKEKKPSQKEIIIALLSDRQWHTTAELNDICFRYGARLWDLRHEGYVFDEQRIGNGPLWRWKLLKTPEQVALEPHLERTEAELAERAERLSEGGDALSSPDILVGYRPTEAPPQDGPDDHTQNHAEVRPVSPSTREYLERMERLDRMQEEQQQVKTQAQLGLAL